MRRRRHLAHEQQVDRLAERQAAHHLVERIAAHQDLVRLDAGQRGAPFRRRSCDASRRGSGSIACRLCGPCARWPCAAASRHTRPVEPIAEIAEAGHDELVRVQALIDRRREDLHVGMVLLDQRDAFGRRDDADHADLAWRRPRAADRAPPRRCRRSPASDRSSARSCSPGPSAASNSTATRPRSSRRAAGRCGRPGRSGSARGPRRACPGRRAAPAPPRRPPRPAGPRPAPSGVCDRDRAEAARRASPRPRAAG